MFDAIRETNIGEDHWALLRSNTVSGWNSSPDCCRHLNTQLFLFSSLGGKRDCNSIKTVLVRGELIW